MDKRAVILITNDDGIHAQGIQELIGIAKKLGDVFVMAPDGERSGMSSAITVNNTIYVKKKEETKGLKVYTCSGTPVDCVKLAVSTFMDKKPDLCISGINHGTNHSLNIIYSGTMGAAIEGGIQGIPSIGFSMFKEGHNTDFNPSLVFVEEIITKAIGNMKDREVINVTIPDTNIIKGFKVAHQAEAIWDQKYQTYKTNCKGDLFFLDGDLNVIKDDVNSDFSAINEGFISVVPVKYDLTDYDKIKEIEKWI